MTQTVKSILLGTVIVFLNAFHLRASVVIKFSVDNGSWSSGPCNPLKGQTVRLKAESARTGEISWYQIIPDCRGYYKNANHPWEPDPYKWVGFAKIPLFRKEIVEARGKSEIDGLLAIQNYDSPFYHKEYGSFWFQVCITSGDSVECSPGLNALDARGLLPNVFRLSIRGTDGYLGFLTSYLNVPGLFGSTPYQSWNYIGVDCADLLVAAQSHYRGVPLTKDYNVAALVTSLRRIATFQLSAGIPDSIVRWGSRIRPGDLIAVRYPGSKQYQHIGALYADANRDGKLDSGDVILHAGPYPLQFDRLGSGGFDGTVSVLRFRD